MNEESPCPADAPNDASGSQGKPSELSNEHLLLYGVLQAIESLVMSMKQSNQLVMELLAQHAALIQSLPSEGDPDAGEDDEPSTYLDGTPR